MDSRIILALAMIAGWGVWTFAFDAPGWAHILLTLGMFLLMYRIAARGTASYPSHTIGIFRPIQRFFSGGVPGAPDDETSAAAPPGRGNSR
jgi:hypothetical protein